MPDSHPGPVAVLWQGFMRGVRSSLSGLPEHRHQDQFLRAKEAALALAESPEMADEIEGAFAQAPRRPNRRPTERQDPPGVVLIELEAYPLAVEIHEAEKKAGTAKPGAGKKLRDAAKTILGSIEDLFKLSDFGKGVISVLKEALELVGGD